MKKKPDIFFCFVITVNKEAHTEAVPASNFRQALSRIPKRYKSFGKLEWIGNADSLSEAIMTCTDWDEKNKVNERVNR